MRVFKTPFIDKLSDDGWTIELFAMAAPNLDRFRRRVEVYAGRSV